MKTVNTLTPIEGRKETATIKQRGIRCNICNKECFSNYRHHFNTCDCSTDGSICFADGGLEYSRVGYHANEEDFELITRDVYKYEIEEK